MPGVVEEGGNIRGQEVLSLTQANHERRVTPRRDDELRLKTIDGDEGEGTFEPTADAPHGITQVVVGKREFDAQQMRDDLGIGLRRHLHSRSGQFLTQDVEVLDDPVVDDGDAKVIAQMRMGVAVRRTTMSCPARMPDSGRGLR